MSSLLRRFANSPAAADTVPTAASAFLVSSTQPFLSATTATQTRCVHGAFPNATVRMQHNKTWYSKTKSHMLTGKDPINTADRPPFPAFAEDVDRPIVIPNEARCFHCNADMHAKRSFSEFVWIPSGNAAKPGPQGYFFCKGCFRCSKCQFRFMHNKFYTTNGKAVCIRCALGKEVRVPERRWHTSFVNSYNTGSRTTGQAFPRFKHELEFLYNPDK